MTDGFTLEPMDVALPRGAFTGGGRDVLRHKSRPVCAFTRATFRPGLHPVWTPKGHVVTAEQPADHPHHRGIWVASDHVALMIGGPDGTERYDYNFYVDTVFQGRAPGRIEQVSLHLAMQSDTRALIEQRLEWIGPVEWGACDGRAVLSERRWTAVSVLDDAFVLDVTSDVTSADNHFMVLGPTRHAWFNARVADAIALDPASAPIDDRGERGAAAIGPRGLAWVDYSGSVGGGDTAGITMIPDSHDANAWFVSDWGVMTVGRIREAGFEFSPGDKARFCCRYVAHDGDRPPDHALAGLAFLTPNTMTEGTMP